VGVVDLDQDGDLEYAKFSIAEVGMDRGSVQVELEVQLVNGLIGWLPHDGIEMGMREVGDNFVDSGGHGGIWWVCGSAVGLSK
jgi:hypothetical protein